jgi:hypothetical protein
MLHVILFVLASVVAVSVTLYFYWVVHCMLDRLCVRHARQFCRHRGWEVCRVRWQPETNLSGGKRVKTESTLVQLDCLDAQRRRRLILLLVWPFGVRRMVGDERYPESYDEQWPQKCV